jgi:mobilome CxxCx(11)CxxC protein
VRELATRHPERTLVAFSEGADAFLGVAGLGSLRRPHQAVESPPGPPAVTGRPILIARKCREILLRFRRKGIIDDVSAEASPELMALKSDLWDKALESTGTAYLFEVRARRLRRRLNNLTFVGFAVPLLIGALVLGYGTAFKALKLLIPLAIGIGVVQVVVFAWSVVAQWVDRYQTSIRAVIANRSLSESFEALARELPPDIGEFRRKVELLNSQDAAQRDFDYLQEIGDAERRMGMHAGLREYQRECPQCEVKPSNMKPTKCGVCGDYRKRWVR